MLSVRLSVWSLTRRCPACHSRSEQRTPAHAPRLAVDNASARYARQCSCSAPAAVAIYVQRQCLHSVPSPACTPTADGPTQDRLAAEVLTLVYIDTREAPRYCRRASPGDPRKRSATALTALPPAHGVYVCLRARSRKESAHVAALSVHLLETCPSGTGFKVHPQLHPAPFDSRCLIEFPCFLGSRCPAASVCPCACVRMYACAHRSSRAASSSSLKSTQREPHRSMMKPCAAWFRWASCALAFSSVWGFWCPCFSVRVGEPCSPDAVFLLAW